MEGWDFTSHDLDYTLDNDITLIYKLNGIALPPERGFPFQLAQKENGDTNGANG